MNVLYISDLFVQICLHIDNTKDLLQLELLSSRHKSIMRNTKWEHFVVKYNRNNYWKTCYYSIFFLN